jgi:hypothetical protein
VACIVLGVLKNGIDKHINQISNYLGIVVPKININFERTTDQLL